MHMTDQRRQTVLHRIFGKIPEPGDVFWPLQSMNLFILVNSKLNICGSHRRLYAGMLVTLLECRHFMDGTVTVDILFEGVAGRIAITRQEIRQAFYHVNRSEEHTS